MKARRDLNRMEDQSLDVVAAVIRNEPGNEICIGTYVALRTEITFDETLERLVALRDGCGRRIGSRGHRSDPNVATSRYLQADESQISPTPWSRRSLGMDGRRRA